MHRVHTENLSKTEKRKVWDEIIQDYLSSNQKLRAYSRQHELNYDQLSYYVGSYKRKHRAEPGFIPVSVPSPSSCESIRLVYQGLTLYFPLDTSTTIIQSIMQGMLEQ